MEHSKSIKLIVIEASGNEENALVRALQESGHTIQHEHASSIESFTNLLGTTQTDLVALIQDESLPGIDDCFIAIQEYAPATPLIYLSDDLSETAVANGLNKGASAVVRSEDTAYLAQIAASLVETNRLKLENTQCKEESAHLCQFSSQLFETTTQAIARIDHGNYIYANPACLNLFGFNTVAEFSGKGIQDIIDTDNQDDFITFVETSDDDRTPMNFHGINTNGKKFEITATVTLDVLGSASSKLITFTSDSQNEILENKLDNMRKYDLLTGLANRQYFIEKLEEHISDPEKKGHEESVIFILLDKFKTLNEEIGIAGSDMVLCDIGKALKDIAGSDDLVSRFGDHTFAILHRTSGTTTPQGFAEKVWALIKSHASDIDGRAITLTGSLGVCIIHEHFTSAQDPLSRADLACEVASSSGGNQIHTHSTSMDNEAEPDHEEQWDNMIRKTIKDERFYLVYQPIVGLNGNTKCQYEVLLRIIDEENEVILPGQFISAAEKAGLSGEIDRWIIENAMKKLVEFRADGVGANFFIKLSDSTISDRSLPKWISEKLRQHRVMSDSIVFEIPMAVACHNLEHAQAFIRGMKGLNCRTALEHFSYEKDQLELLQHLPADILKIDSALANNLVGNKDNQESIKAIIALAHKQNMQSIAERVDDAGNLAFLWQFGIDFIQGNFVQEPSTHPVYDFEEQVA